MTPEDSGNVNRLERSCFFISPIGSKGSGERKAADQVKRHLVDRALSPLGFTVLRADQDSDTGLVTTRTIDLIKNSELIVVDLSTHNPNVFYEMAVAHGFRRPVVHIQRAGEATPFDVKDLRLIRYDLADPDELETAQEDLARLANLALSNPQSPQSPLSAFDRFLSMQDSEDPVVASQQQILAILDQLRDDILAKNIAPQPVDWDRGEMVAVGVVRISNGGAAHATEYLRAASRIRILVTSGVNLFESYQSYLTDALVNGCQICVLLPDPDGGFVRDVQELESVERPRPTRISDEIHQTVEVLGKALDQARAVSFREWNRNVLGGVRIGYFSTQFRSTMILCDEKWGWITLALPPAKSGESFSMELLNTGGRPLFALCSRHFDNLWNYLDSRGRVQDI